MFCILGFVISKKSPQSTFACSTPVELLHKTSETELFLCAVGKEGWAIAGILK
jgi:hypothetical protein